MRAISVPAQITTVEDKIVGELSITQLMLLVAPIFSGAAIFVVLPPFYAYAPYKMAFIVCITVFFAALAVRIKSRIVLHWLLILTRYNARPRYYLFNKNDLHLRDIAKPEAPQKTIKATESEKARRQPLPHLSPAELVRAEALIANPAANLHFRTDKKGALSVYVTEVK